MKSIDQQIMCTITESETRVSETHAEHPNFKMKHQQISTDVAYITSFNEGQNIVKDDGSSYYLFGYDPLEGTSAMQTKSSPEKARYINFNGRAKFYQYFNHYSFSKAHSGDIKNKYSVHFSPIASNTDPFKGMSTIKVEASNEDNLICPICSERFCKVHNLEIHEGNQTKVKRFLCHLCKKRFPSNYSLETHLRSHTGDKPFICSLCKKRFNTSGSLKRHSRVHTGERPYWCSECGNTFSHKFNLKTHSIVHTGKKPFICNICNKRFTRKQNLTRHSRIHTGEKPFNCKDCGSWFALKTSLKTHSWIHTDVKPFICNKCNKGFKDQSNLRRHLRFICNE